MRTAVCLELDGNLDMGDNYLSNRPQVSMVYLRNKIDVYYTVIKREGHS